MIVGNRIMPDCESALRRARMTAAPLNVKRLEKRPLLRTGRALP